MPTHALEDQPHSWLDITNLQVRFDGHKVLDDLHLQLDVGQRLCILGASGCGKSTLLRTIAGFEKIHQGQIYTRDMLLSSRQFILPPEKRHIGMVFQDVALFPHLNVEDNIAFGLRHLDRHQQQQRVNELLALVDLVGFNQRYPHVLSGGQQQRVALARAIAPKPTLLLMDEPFNGLDAILRESLAPEVAAILEQEKITAILVTHDQKEAFAFADQVAVMHEGKIEQVADVYDIYHRPSTRFVASFVGEGDFVRGQLRSGHLHSCLGEVPLNPEQLQRFGETDMDVDIFIRPDDVLHDDDSPIQGRIVGRRFRGTHFLYRIQLPEGDEIACFADSHHDHPLGYNLGISFNLQHVLLFDVHHKSNLRI